MTGNTYAAGSSASTLAAGQFFPCRLVAASLIFLCALLVQVSVQAQCQAKAETEEPAAIGIKAKKEEPTPSNSPGAESYIPNRAVQQPPPAAQPTPEPALSAGELANQINNPAAPVTFVQFRNILLPNVPGTGGVTNAFQIQPVIPIHKSESLPFLQLIKITIPVLSAPSPFGKTGLGDVQFFDLVSIKQSWGRWGFGPAIVFPTATSRELGAGKLQIGPSFALIYTKVENLTVGAVFQNPVSVAGSGDRPGVNNLIITPTFTYNFPGYLFPNYWKHGWFMGLSDFNLTFDWENDGAATIPLGIQLGRVFHIGDQPFSASAEAGGTVKRPPNTRNPGLIIGIEVSVIFKGHRKDQ